jgi:hypothetical protein
MTIRKEPEGGEFKEMPTEKLYDLFLKLHGHLGKGYRRAIFPRGARHPHRHDGGHFKNAIKLERLGACLSNRHFFIDVAEELCFL